MSNTTTVTSQIETSVGLAEIKVTHHVDDHRLALHCYYPPCGGAGLFMMFNGGVKIADATWAMRTVIQQGPYEANQNLTGFFNFRGCLAIGTGEVVSSLALDMIKATARPTKQLPL